MNLDFHYYVTYIAARNAGFDDDRALTIAQAAQYVDVSDKDMIKPDLLEGRETTPTFETTYQLFKKNNFTKDSELAESKDIWSAFHFLPGNFGDDPYRVMYEGPKSWLKWDFDDNDRRDFKYLCMPNSNLSAAIINNAATYNTSPFFNHIIGIVMHTLADTWAHRYFAGLNSWWINEVGTDVFWTTTSKRIDFSTAKLITSLEVDLPYVCTPPGVTFKSYYYLGHGRMGHVPDLPFARYYYTPGWSKITYQKDNPDEFLKAYNQLVYAMTQIRTGQPYEKDRYYTPVNDDDKFLQTEISKRLQNMNYKEKDSESIWNPLIERMYGSGIAKYNNNSWLDKAITEKKANRNVRDTSYYKFNQAAVIHLNFVKGYINDHINI